MLDLFTITAIAGTFLLAGVVKGVIGLGLPTLSLGLLATTLDLPTAMALLIVPSFVTNLWQAIVGDNGRAVLVRIWPFLLIATATVWLGAIAMTYVHLSFLSGLLGGILVIYSTLNLTGVRIAIPVHSEIWAAPLFGTANGILAGMTGSFVVPGVMFLQSIGLSRDMLVQAMGMLFTASTVALALALCGNSLLTAQLSLVSAAAVIPAMVGMVTGHRIRRKFSEDQFRQISFIVIFLLGTYIITKATLGVW